MIGQEIIDYIKRNRVSTTEVADALGKSGVIPDVLPINRGYHKVGFIKWVYAYDNSNWSLHKQIESIDEDRIVFVDSFNCEGRAIFGELVSKYLLLYRQEIAIVVNGKMRDAASLIREKWPIWCTGFTPLGCFNEKPINDIEQDLKKNAIEKYDGAIAVCDDCGVVVIPKSNITEEMLGKLEQIEFQEDIWFDRLDHYKESTYSIVCKKEYLTDDGYMSNK